MFCLNRGSKWLIEVQVHLEFLEKLTFWDAFHARDVICNPVACAALSHTAHSAGLAATARPLCCVPQGLRGRLYSLIHHGTLSCKLWHLASILRTYPLFRHRPRKRARKWREEVPRSLLLLEQVVNSSRYEYHRRAQTGSISMISGGLERRLQEEASWRFGHDTTHEDQ